MKISDKIYNYIIIFLIILIVIVIMLKLTLNNKNNGFEINNLNRITVFNYKEGIIKFINLLNSNLNTVLFIEIDNCGSCIFKGINELNKLKRSSYIGIVVVIHDNPEYIKGWIDNLNYKKVYILKKKDFYDNFKCPYLPVLVTFSNYKIKNFRYISN